MCLHAMVINHRKKIWLECWVVIYPAQLLHFLVGQLWQLIAIGRSVLRALMNLLLPAALTPEEVACLWSKDSRGFDCHWDEEIMKHHLQRALLKPAHAPFPLLYGLLELLVFALHLAGPAVSSCIPGCYEKPSRGPLLSDSPLILHGLLHTSTFHLCQRMSTNAILY